MELRDKVRGMALDRKVAKVTLVGVPDRPGHRARPIFEPLADQGINVDMIVQNVGHDGTTDMSFTVERGRTWRGPSGCSTCSSATSASRQSRPTRRWPRSRSSARASTTRQATRRGCSGRSPTRASTSR